MDANFIIRLLELTNVLLAYIIIIDQKSDGDLDLLNIDEKYGEELDTSFKNIIEKFKEMLECIRDTTTS